MAKEFLLEDQPEFRRKVLEKAPKTYAFVKKYNDILFKENGANPNEMGLKILPKIKENYIRKREGKKLIPFTKEETKFMNNKIPLEWYLELTTTMVNDPEYLTTLIPIEVTKMDQKNNPEGWMKARGGQFPDYTKASPGSPSGVNPLINPKDARWAGTSLTMQKHKKQGLPVAGDEDTIDEDTSVGGHLAEDIALIRLKDVMKHQANMDVDDYKPEEAMFEHFVFGDFLQGNMDGQLVNLDTMEIEGVEVKSTSYSASPAQVIKYKEGKVSSDYITQTACYMAMHGFNVVNLIATWGYRAKSDFAVIRIHRDLNSEARLLGTLLWFMIEIVIKDGDIDDELNYLAPSVLVKDLYAIYGNAVVGKTVEVTNSDVFDTVNRLEDVELKIKALKDRHKEELAPLMAELDLCEAKILEQAEDAERLDVSDGVLTKTVFLKSKTTSRFSTKLFDDLIKEYNKGKIDKDTLLSTILDRKNLESSSTSRSVKVWKKN